MIGLDEDRQFNVANPERENIKGKEDGGLKLRYNIRTVLYAGQQ